MSNFQNPTAPQPGGRICRTHLAFNKGGGGSARPPGSAPAHALVLRATPGATAPKTNNPQMGVACCFGVCVSSSAASALKCTPRSVDEGRQGRRRTRCSANKDPPRMRNPERVKWSTCGEMICHALSGSDKVHDSSRSTKSPFCRGGNALHVDSLDTPFIAQTCPRANCKRRRTPSWQLHKWESKSYHSPQCL